MVHLNDDINNDEIDIKTIIKFFIRNKINFFKIFSLLFVSSIFGISQIKPNYEGNLKLEINREIINKENGSTNKPLGVNIDDNLINIASHPVLPATNPFSHLSSINMHNMVLLLGMNLPTCTTIRKKL